MATSDSTPRCKHDSGWYSADVMVIVSDAPASTWLYALRAHRTGRNKLLMRCNRVGCNAVRNAYFDREFGGFVKFGKVRAL